MPKFFERALKQAQLCLKDECFLNEVIAQILDVNLGMNVKAHVLTVLEKCGRH